MLSIGLIGCGFMGHIHAEVYKLLSFENNINLSAVCDIEKNKADTCAQLCGSRAYTDADSVIYSDNIDAIDICLPTHIHFEYAKKAIMAGKDLFIEKPVTLTPNEAEELLELKHKYNTNIMVGQCLRFWNEYIKLKEITDSGKYGNLNYLTLKRLSQKPDWGYNNWYYDPEKSGGVIIDLHIHDADFMLYLLGIPEKIIVEGTNDHTYSLFKYKNETRVLIESGWNFPESYPVETEYRAQFENAVVTFKGNGINIYEKSGKHFIIENNPENPNDPLCIKAHGYGGYYKELEYFCNRLANGEKIEINTPEEACETLKLIYEEIKNV